MLRSILEAIRPWTNVLLFGLNAAVGALLWAARRSFATQDELATERKARTEMEKRLTTVEHSLSVAPTRTELSKLVVAIEELRGDMREHRAEMAGARETFAAQIKRVDQLVERTERSACMLTEHLLAVGR